MKKFFKKASSIVLISVSVWLAGIQNAQGQSSLHDSLEHLLIYFQENSRDKNLKQAVKEARAIYKPDTINDSLSTKLLQVDSILITTLQPNPQMILTYTRILSRLFQQLPPREEHPYYVATLSNLGKLYMTMGRYEEALPLLEKDLDMTRKTSGEEHPDYAASLCNLASLYCYMGRYEEALPLFLKDMAITEKNPGKDHFDYSISLNNVANLYSTIGEYGKALPLYEKALSIRQKTVGEEHPAYINSLNNLADLFYLTGQYENALPLLQRALDISKKISGDDHPNHASSLNNLANVYYAKGRHDIALPLYQKAVEVRKKVQGEKHPDYAHSLSNLATVYCNIGYYEKALTLCYQSRSILKKAVGEKHPNYTAILNNMAYVYNMQGHYEKALPLYKKALAIRKEVPGEGHPDYATSLFNLANLYFAWGKYNEVLPLLQQALTVTKKARGEDHPDYAQTLTNLASFYYTTGRYGEALPLFRQANDIVKKVQGEKHPDYAAGLNNLGMLYSALNKDATAATLLTQASGITLEHLRQTYTTLTEQEKMIFLKKKSDPFGYLPSLLFYRPATGSIAVHQLYANELALKGMVLEDQQQVLHKIRNSSDSTARELLHQWQFNRSFMGKQILLPVAKRIQNLDSLQEATRQLEQELSRRAASFRNLQHNLGITPANIAQKLLPGEAAVEFIRFNLHNKKWTDSILYAALVIRSGDTGSRFIPLFEEKQLKRLLEPLSYKSPFKKYAAIENLYGRGINSSSKAMQHHLYRLLWEPLEKYLAGSHTVYYAPAGLLHRVAFTALRPNDARFLIEKFRLRQVLSTRSVVLAAKRDKKPASVCLWGNIDYNNRSSSQGIKADTGSLQRKADTGASFFDFYTADARGIRAGAWGSLPGTKKEIDSLNKLFQNTGIAITIDSGAVATEEAFKALSGRSPQVLHLATHGFFLPVREKKAKSFNDQDAGGRTFTIQQNPMFRSGLVLAGGNRAWIGKPALPGREDGILTAYEIAQMDLSGTDLVVLSACETALGDVQGNEGVIGLQRAFKMAGVKQLILTLWQVPDEQTSELMTLFYRNWLSGQSTREALRSAQLKIKEKYPPFYWAAFVLAE